MSVRSRTAARLTRWSSRWVPGSFTIAVGLTAVVFLGGMAAGIFLKNSTPMRAAWACVIAWGDGVWTLLEFGMQMCLVIFTGYIIAVSRPVRNALTRLVLLPRTPAGVILVVSAAAMLLAWVNWGLGLVAGAMLTRIVARERRSVDYRLLVACAYLGLGTTWHAGLSGSVPLLMATPDHFLIKTTGTIPVSETIFWLPNVLFVFIAFAVVLILVRLMVPPPQDAVAPAGPIGDDDEPPRRPPNPTPAERMEHSVWPNILVASVGLGALVHHFATQGPSLSLNTVNLAFLCIGIALHGTPASLVAAAERGAGLLHGIVLQFPLYAGMFGIIKGTGLADVIAGAFVSVSGGGTYPLVVTLYSGLLNYFVPSGGSKWAVEAPYILQAASDLGVPVRKVLLAYAYGDMWTNLIQPFWAIPILAAAKLEFKDILGYEIIVCAVYGLLISAGALALGFFF